MIYIQILDLSLVNCSRTTKQFISGSKTLYFLLGLIIFVEQNFISNDDIYNNRKHTIL